MLQEERVGLRNLGSTCYVNSLLQIWFHTPGIRRAVLDWRVPVDGGGTEDVRALRELQRVFAFLQASQDPYAATMTACMF